MQLDEAKRTLEWTAQWLRAQAEILRAGTNFGTVFRDAVVVATHVYQGLLPSRPKWTCSVPFRAQYYNDECRQWIIARALDFERAASTLTFDGFNAIWKPCDELQTWMRTPPGP